jgi:hypothetical protein
VKCLFITNVKGTFIGMPENRAEAVYFFFLEAAAAFLM